MRKLLQRVFNIEDHAAKELKSEPTSNTAAVVEAVRVDDRRAKEMAIRHREAKSRVFLELDKLSSALTEGSSDAKSR